MNFRNVEFKANVNFLAPYETILLELGAKLIGLDHQIDTYFSTNKGRLKLREGTIENALIQYYRQNDKEEKLSKISLYPHSPDLTLKEILVHQFGIKVIVDKKRKIYTLNNAKFGSIQKSVSK